MDHAPPRRLLDQVDALRYVTAPNAPTYRAIVQVCYDALQRYVIELRPHDVLRDLEASGLVHEVDDVEDLEVNYLANLVRWGNLASTADPSGVDRLEDFYRRRLIYHLTDAGEAAHRAVAEVEATVGRSGSLQATMLSKIRDALHALATAGPDAEPDRLLGLLHDLGSAFETLTHEANRFMTDLGRLIGDDREDGASDTRFLTFKQAVLTYVSRFVEQLRRIRDEVVAGLEAVEAAGVDAIVASASRSADLPDFEGDGSARVRWADDQRDRWAGVRVWFVGDDRTEATVDRLAEFAVGAVLRLTRSLQRLNDRRGRPVDRTTDLLTLAQWFAGCHSDEAAHELWHVAFGLHSARHLHLADEDPDTTSTRTSWWDAEPVAVPTRLRTHGRTVTQGRPPRAADHSQQRRWLAAKARRERAQLEAAVARFAGRDEIPLSALGELETNEFDLLLQLLDTALTAPRDGSGARSARTIDGRLEITLHHPESDATCTLTTPDGRLQTPDYRVTVTDLAAPARAAAAGRSDQEAAS